MRYITEATAKLIETALMEYILHRKHEPSTRVQNQIRLMRKALTELRNNKKSNKS